MSTERGQRQTVTFIGPAITAAEPPARAASRAQEEFVSIVATVVGEEEARRYGALLFSSAYGIAELGISGHLTEEKWRTTAEDLIATLVVMTANNHPATRTNQIGSQSCSRIELPFSFKAA